MPDEGADRVRGRLMRQSLQALLDQVTGSREVLPHLAALERGLGRHGCTAIDKVAPHWLLKIYSQLSSLPMADDDLPLQDLLDRLARALQAQRGWPAAVRGEGNLEIREISHSEFDAARQEQATTLHGDP